MGLADSSFHFYFNERYISCPGIILKNKFTYFSLMQKQYHTKVYVNFLDTSPNKTGGKNM